MTSLVGFLEPGPNGPRMTAAQAALVLRGVHAAIDQQTGVVSPDVTAGLAYARTIIAGVLNAYPHDRSCHTCDFAFGGGCDMTCRFFDGQPNIPVDAQERGCDHHQTDGTPF